MAILFCKTDGYVIKQREELHSAVDYVCVCVCVFRERFMWSPFRSKSCSTLSAFTLFAFANGADGENQRERENKREMNPSVYKDGHMIRGKCKKDRR